MSIDLAMLFKCDPFRFLDRTDQEVSELYRRTVIRLREQRQAAPPPS